MMRIALLLMLLLTVVTPAAAAPADITLPSGFSIAVFASGLGKVRLLAVHPTTGVLYASQMNRDRIVALPDTNKDGVADKVVQFAAGIVQAHGLVWHGDDLYVAGNAVVMRFSDKNHDMKADGAGTKIADLPSGGGHFTRTIRVGPDNKLYVSIGSTCNVCVESHKERASIIQMNLDGSGRTLYASGLRNAVGITFDSAGKLWAVNNGRDWLGNELPPEALYQVTSGGFYGWPYAYGNKVPDPDFGDTCKDCVARTIAPAWEFPAHTAPLGLNFYTGDKWGADFKGDLFVGCHGSWNSTYKKGYNVMRVEFENGRPVRAAEFISGFLRGKNDVWARPVDIITGGDGQMYLTDDMGGRVFRIKR